MKLLFPSGLWLLFALLGVVVIYLLRMPRRQIPVADLAPWLSVARAGRRISKERRTMISLALQACIALSLIVGFARPYFAASNGGQFELVLIDLSRSTRAYDYTPLKVLEGTDKASVSGSSRLELEKDALRSMIRAMNTDDRMTIIGVAERPVIIASGESEPAILERMVTELEARDETANFGPACQLVTELAKSEKNVRATLICDGSVDAKDFAPLNSLPADAGKIRVVTTGKNAENVGITGFKVRKTFNSDDIEVTVTMFSSAKQPLKVPVELYLDGKTQSASIAEIAPGESKTINFQMGYRLGGVLKAHLALQDAILDDNDAFDYLPAPKRTRVTLITKDPMDEKVANDYYLAKVLRCDTAIEGGFLPASDYAKIAQDKKALKAQFDAVIFDNWTPAADQLPPCHALFINAETPEIPAAVKGVLGDRPLIRKWDEGHPLMNYLNLRDVFLKQAKQLQLDDKSTDVVAELVSSPLILAREIGHKKLAYIGFNPADSDIQFKKELPLFVLNCFEWFKRGIEPVTQIAPGEPMTITVSDSSWKSVIVLPPNGAPGRKITILDGAESVMFYDTFKPGIYRYMGDTEKAPRMGFAVYFGSAKESNLNVTSTIQIGVADDQGRITENRAELTATDKLVEHHVSSQMWMYFAVLAAGLLAVENYLFHRRVFF
jgi:hypothetical protein